MSQLVEYRAEKDEFFERDPQSPLTTDQKQLFSGLRYFPENQDLRFEVSLERVPDAGRIEVQTSTGETQLYKRLGRFRFPVGDEEAELTIFEGANGLFLPFVDSLAGKETYPAGRYVEPELLPGNRYRIDFNLAYNPYCAYNEHWSCPLTPFENRLRVPMFAGEKIYSSSH